MGRPALRLLACSLLLGGGLAAALLSGASLAASPSTTATAPTTVPGSTTTLAARSVLVLTGHGWGHGLGMSQWGAYGYAKHGWTYDRILAHYYVGTTLGQTPVRAIRVLLTQEKKATLTAAAPWTVTDAAGQALQLDQAAPLRLTGALTVAGQVLTPPLTFRSTQPLSLDGRAYRGRLVVTVAGKTVQVVDVVGLEAYVKGVVPSEMPSGWAVQALEAQAVATRSYALANASPSRGFDVYGDGRSQVYGGVAAESPTASAAVDATAHQVVMYAGKVADTMFSSSSGGRTASAQETTGVAIPYLVSVADPYDTISPNHDWGPVLFDLAKVARALKLPAAIADLQVTTGTSGRARAVSALLDDETTASFTGNQLRSLLGLRSTWFTPALFELLPPKKAVTYGGAGSLTGFARGAVTGPVTLEERATGGVWTPAGDLAPAPDGSFSTIVQPQVTTQYRLVAGTLHVAVAKVGVAPLLTVQQTGDGLGGSLSPALTAAQVALQQLAGTTWTTISSTVTDANGSWTLQGALGPGTYRVRTAPGQGFAAAISAPLQIP